MPNIVNLNVTRTVGSAPATLQQTGALVSQGATNTSIGTYTLLTEYSDLETLLMTPIAITSIATATGTATVTTASPHGWPVGDTFPVYIQNNSVPAYNGLWTGTVASTNTITFSISGSHASGTGGTIEPESVLELQAMVRTFFDQGTALGVYVLELGVGSVDQGVAALQTYLDENPNSDYTPGATGYFYGYVVPRTWDGAASFLTLLANYESLTAKTYFFVTTTLATYSNYPPTMKCVFPLIQSPQFGQYSANALTAISYSAGVVTATTTTPHGVQPGNWFTISGCTPTGYNGTWLAQSGTTGSTLVYDVPSDPGVETVLGTLVASLHPNTGAPYTEFSISSAFYQFLNNTPSAANRVPPFAYRYVYGVTAFPTRGNNSILTLLKQNNINVIGTGAEGGLSNTILTWGTMADGKDATYWISVDWVQIASNIALSAAIINGSNNPQNPLYYDQPGVNTLQAVEQNVMNTAIEFGLALGPIKVSAIPFVQYVTANPSDYTSGIYNGLYVTFTPNRGFIDITLNINVTDFPSA